MSTQIQFELVSPEEKLVSEGVYLAEIPGDEGSIGVMSGHESLVSSLRVGVVRLHKDDTRGGDIKEIFITGGFADVTPDNCTVLAEEAINVSDLDQKDLEQQLSNLNEDLSLAQEQEDKNRIEKRITITQAKLNAAAA